MKFSPTPEVTIDWSQAQAVAMPGVTGVAHARAHQTGDLQMRIVEYGPGYLADHWCSKGHVLHVIAGELTIEHEDGGPPFALSAGMTWHAADHCGSAHRVRSASGATVFIVD